MKYAITGSTGGFGSAAVDHLIGKGIDPSDITALARSAEKAAGLKTRGVDVRIADYGDRVSLLEALEGVDRVLLVSGSEVGKRFEQHSNVIEAAKSTGVKFLVYTSLTRADISENPLAPEHKQTEEALKESGINYAILRNNWYLENYLADVQYAARTGVLATATADGRVASALRSEYAEAAVNVLTGEDHRGKTLELSGKPWTFNDLAASAASVYGNQINYTPVSGDERKAGLLDAGMDEGSAGFYTLLDESIARGSLDIESTDLKELLGREPAELTEALRALK
ncbi:MAG: SDR family oxidoreductase [Spirochaetales bacterium]|nr:SDR family oxidoreductase [Spirochaetales bacterium]